MALKRARRDPLPDIIVSGGVRYNRELLEQSPGGTARRPVGIEGYFDIGVQIPIFNRNQGAVSTAKADAERARLEVDRTKLALRVRMATVYREYQDAMATIERYRTQMIPRAQQSYDLYLKSFQAMAASYPQVLIAQRNLFQLQEEYITTLVAAWQRSIEINGMLLSDVMQRNVPPRSGAMPAQNSSSDGGND
jgi:cobalt-zinc-cadmium efflux system outer membrane protein